VKTASTESTLPVTTPVNGYHPTTSEESES
jgi:hypothetical protein